MLLSEQILIGLMAIYILTPFSARSAVIKDPLNSSTYPKNSVEIDNNKEENDNQIHHQRSVEDTDTTEDEINTYIRYKKSYPFPVKMSQRIKKSVSGLSMCSVKKISHGYSVPSGKYPWFIVIENTTKEGKSKKICGGVLVTPDIVLTATHCFMEPKESNEPSWSQNNVCKSGEGYKVYSWQDQGKKTGVKKIEWHRQYRKTGSIYKQDIAIMYLETSIGVSESLPCFYPDNIPGAGDKCVAMGIGETETGEKPESLREKTVEVSQCKMTKIFPYQKLQGHISCMPLVANHGDSGGPLVCESKHGSIPYLAGIISKKDKMTNENTLTSLMRGSDSFSWLEDKLRQNPKVIEGQCNY